MKKVIGKKTKINSYELNNNTRPLHIYFLNNFFIKLTLYGQ